MNDYKPSRDHPWRGMFNSEQLAWMDYLATLKPDQKCDCGWDKRGNCTGSCYGQPEKGGVVREEPRS